MYRTAPALTVWTGASRCRSTVLDPAATRSGVLSRHRSAAATTRFRTAARARLSRVPAWAAGSGSSYRPAHSAMSSSSVGDVSALRDASACRCDASACRCRPGSTTCRCSASSSASRACRAPRRRSGLRSGSRLRCSPVRGACCVAMATLRANSGYCTTRAPHGQRRRPTRAPMPRTRFPRRDRQRRQASGEDDHRVSSCVNPLA